MNWIAELEQAHEAATLGEWRAGWWSGGQVESMCVCEHKGELVLKVAQTTFPGKGPFHIHASDFFPDDHEISSVFPGVQVAGNYDYKEGGIIEKTDLDYIVLAHNSMPKILGILKAAEEYVEKRAVFLEAARIFKGTATTGVNGGSIEFAEYELSRDRLVAAVRKDTVTDIADLVAKLDALEKDATTEGTYDDGSLFHDTGDETCEPDCRACAFEAALEAAWPKELRSIVVAAKEWADEFECQGGESYEAERNLYAAVRGEA